ncbi:hypothetical protein EBB07_33485 [Paenibacillaceae bacterium]|nr:hypothetical protein EBB07_33485 [Paenibacillaceae bacterium]
MPRLADQAPVRFLFGLLLQFPVEYLYEMMYLYLNIRIYKFGILNRLIILCDEMAPPPKDGDAIYDCIIIVSCGGEGRSEDGGVLYADHMQKGNIG